MNPPIKSDLKSGFLPIYKPRGVGSTPIVTFFKRLLKPRKIGHTGTLDPMAEGVLILAINDATKAIPYTENKTKTYEFNIVFGTETDTLDADGEILNQSNILPSLEALQQVLPKFTGKITQIPPKYSALKINGKRAYDMAREGLEVEIKPREVEIFNLQIISAFTQKVSLEDTSNKPHGITEVAMKAEVSRGTYIRTLAVDIANSLGALAHINYLNRYNDGVFSLHDTLKLPIPFKPRLDNFSEEDLQKLKTSAIQRIADISAVLDDIPVLHLESPECKALRNGLKVERNGLEEGVKYQIYNNDILHSICQYSAGKLKVIRCFNL